MTLKSRILDHLFFLIMGTVYTYALSKSILEPTVLSVSDSTLFFLSLSLIFIFGIYFFNKYTSIFFTALILFIAVFAYMQLAADSFETKWYAELSKFLYEAYWFVRGYFPHNESYDFALAALTVFAVALVASVNIKVRFGFYILSVFGGCVILIPVAMNYIRTNEASMIFSFCFMVFLIKKLNLSAKSSKTKSNAEFSMAIIPICACLCLLAGVLPMPGANTLPDRSGLVSGSAMEAANDFFYAAFNPKYFSFQTTGFTGKDGRLGGKVTANGRFIMEVYSDERVYLSGAVKDNYTGWSWRNTKAATEALKENEDSYFDLTAGSGGLFDSLGERGQVRINVGGSRTQTIFTPANAKGISFDSQVKLYQNGAGALSVEKLLNKNTGYAIDYISNSVTGLSNTINGIAATGDASGHIILQDILTQLFIAGGGNGEEFKGEADLSAYLELPEALPRRVYDLTDEITRGAPTSFEKLKALEKYLQGFSYTLEPEDVPNGEDFVDYFLFTGKEGYCTYYASALAVMGRCAGIPTRYLEGYVMPPVKNSNGAYEVTSYQAHAWVEGYINGLGWVAFEPTAPFSYSFYSSEAHSAAVPREVFSNSMYENDSSYYEYMMQMGFHQQQEAGTPALQRAVRADNKIEATLEFILMVTAGTLLFAFVLSSIFMTMVLARYLKFRKIDKSSNRDAVIAYFAHILKVAKVYTYPIMRNETAFAYAERVGRRFAFENETIYMSDLARIFSKASYGKNEITDQEKLRMKECYFEFLGMLRMYRLFKIQFILYKYVICII